MPTAQLSERASSVVLGSAHGVHGLPTPSGPPSALAPLVAAGQGGVRTNVACSTSNRSSDPQGPAIAQLLQH
eukprot:2306755-Alexandrium_andersonii.AAC.1